MKAGASSSDTHRHADPPPETAVLDAFAVDNDHVSIEEALDALYRQAVLWLVEERGVEPVVRAACDTLAAGLDNEALRELAARSVHSASYDGEVDELIHAALSELGRPLPARETDAAKRAAVVAMASEMLAGRLTPRELAAWAHRVIGHTGPEEAQALVSLDDCYDELEWAQETEEDIDRHVLEEARKLAARR